MFVLLLHSHAVFTVCHTQPHLMLSIALPTHTHAWPFTPHSYTQTHNQSALRRAGDQQRRARRKELHNSLTAALSDGRQGGNQ